MASTTDIQHARARVVEAARQFLANQIGVIDVARAINRERTVLDPQMTNDELTGFMAIDSESDRLAYGPVIDHWHLDLRVTKLREIEEFENFYRANAVADAQVLLRRYEISLSQ
jgi:hypothetical protein